MTKYYRYSIIPGLLIFLMILPNNELRELLISSKTLTENKIKDLQSLAKNSQATLQETVIERGFISDKKLGLLIADSLTLPFVELSKMLIPEEIFHIIPERIARKQKIIAFSQDNGTLSLGLADPNNRQVVEILEKKTSKKAVVHYATETDIATTVQMYRKNLQEEVDGLIQAETAAVSGLSETPIIKIVDLIIAHAYRDKASDIHIEPEEECVLIRFRIDSILQDVLRLDRNLHSSVVARIKVLANLRTDEHLDAQDGKLRRKVDDEFLDIRVSVIPSTEGEKIVLRLLSSRFRSFSLSDLGMNKQDVKKVEDVVNKSYGMILSTGPTGSGKTTSIYSLLKILNTREKNITTIEDPVEYRIKGVVQIPANTRSNFTFARGLRSILRQDPNVIFVGEIRDSETASLGVNAALTGHLVLSTLHTNDAATAIPRLIDMKVEPSLLASTVNLIIAQRLMRKICTICKTEISLSRSEIRKNISEKTIQQYFGKKDNIKVYEGKGCKVCHNTGYSGRIGIYEVLEISEKIRKVIVQKNDASAIRKIAISEGMTTLLDDGMQKVLDGTTTIEELLRVMKIENL